MMIAASMTYKMKKKRSLRGVEGNVQVCDIIVSQFKLKTFNYVYFRSETIVEGMNLLIAPVMG